MTRSLDLGVEDVEQVLTELYGLEAEHKLGIEFLMLCPDPKHLDSRPSCSVNLETGYWNCFSCQAGGDLVDLGALVLKKKRLEVVNLLKKEDAETLLRTLQSRLSRLSPYTRGERHPKPPQGPYDPGPLSYMRQRGFHASTLERWGVRWCPEQELMGSSGKPFTLQNSIALPVRDLEGTLRAWIYRSTNSSPSWQPRYLNSNPFHKWWFGEHLYGRAQELVIAEGPLDAMAIDQAGMPAMAIAGATAFGEKVYKLTRHRTVYLFGDADAAGLMWVRQVGEYLSTQGVSVRVVRWPSWALGNDPGEIPPVDIELMIQRAISYQSWILVNHTG